MARNLIVTCDVCGGEGASTYTITHEATTWSVDLDAQHAEPLLQIATRGTETSASRIEPRGSGGSMRNWNSRVRGLPPPDGTR